MPVWAMCALAAMNVAQIVMGVVITKKSFDRKRRYQEIVAFRKGVQKGRS